MYVISFNPDCLCEIGMVTLLLHVRKLRLYSSWAAELRSPSRSFWLQWQCGWSCRLAAGWKKGLSLWIRGPCSRKDPWTSSRAISSSSINAETRTQRSELKVLRSGCLCKWQNKDLNVSVWTPALILFVAPLTSLRMIARRESLPKSHIWITWGSDHRD